MFGSGIQGRQGSGLRSCHCQVPKLQGPRWNVDALHSLLETGKRKGTDLVLMQEPPDNPDFRPSHPAREFLWTKGKTLAARR